MARRVAAAGHDLTVWNRTGVRADVFLASAPEGARVRAAPSAAAAVAHAEVVISCLSTSRDVLSMLRDPPSPLEAVGPGTVWVDCTSGDPPTSREIASELGARTVPYLDAPVSGGISGAEQGTLTIMCGGDPAVLDRVRPVLGSFGAKIVHCGPVGAGDAVKAVNNALMAVCLWSAGEGLAALCKAGVSPAVALDVINSSSGRSNATMNLIPRRVLTREFPRTFRLALLDKDVATAAAFARDEQVPSPLIQLTAELIRIAHDSLGDAADHVESLKLIEGWAAVEIA